MHRIKVGKGGEGESEVMNVANGRKHDMVIARHGETKGNVETMKKKYTHTHTHFEGMHL